MSLKAEFGVPASHTLKEVGAHAKGHMGQNESWRHEEYDSNGNLVARFESWSNTDIKTSKTNSGWRKLDLDGNVIASSDKLEN